MDFNQPRFAAKKSSRERASQRMRWVMLIVLLVCAGSGALLYRSRETVLPVVTASVDHIKQWLAERKNHLNKGLVKVKKLAAANKNEAEPQIHFEFYSALPSMQMSAPVAAENTKATPPSAIASKTPVKKLPHGKSIVDAASIERELSEQIKQTNSYE